MTGPPIEEAAPAQALYRRLVLEMWPTTICEGLRHQERGSVPWQIFAHLRVYASPFNTPQGTSRQQLSHASSGHIRGSVQPRINVRQRERQESGNLAAA